jgi:hypothetical protein
MSHFDLPIDPDAWTDFWAECKTNRVREAFNQMAVEMDEDQEHELRAMPYEEFLNSSYWQIVRDLMLDTAGYRCQNDSASDQPLHVHHLTYDHRGSEWRHLEDLVVLCAKCHGRCHR